MIPISSQSPTLPSHNSLNYELLSLTAICGEVPCTCSARLTASESYRKKVVTSLTHDKLLRIFSRHHLRGYRLGVRGKRLLLQQEPERFAFYLSGLGEFKWTSYFTIALAVCIFASIMYIICFRSVKENVIPDDKEEFSLRLAMRNIFQNQPLLCVQLSNVACLLAMTLRGYLNYYYCMYNLGNLTIASLLSLITLVGMIVGSILFIVGSKIVGKRNCMFGIAIIYTAINIFQYLSGWSSIPVILVCATISNICMGAAIVCVNAMLADTIEYGEWKTGQRNEAMITSTRCFVTKCVSAVSGLVIALVIAVTGMVPQAAEQAPVVLNSFHFIYTLGSAGIMILAVVPMAFYKLTEKRHAEIMAELAARKQKD